MDPLPVLSAWDYVVIFAMLSISVAIGIFFAHRSRRRQSSDNYFLGDRDMSVIPVAISLAATYISAITYLGTPAEVYFYGPKYGLMSTVRLFVPIVVMYCFVPVFYRLEITTVYEYLERRFNNTMRFLIITAEIIGGFIYMGIVVYAPSLALSTATGLSLSFSILTIGLICTFYTTIGGIKAVIWTDVFQGVVMLVGAIVMIMVGTAKLGGPAEGWRRATIGQRTHLVDFNIDPTVRLSFWSIYIGGSSFLLMILGTKQSYIQRALACNSVRQAQFATYIGAILSALLELLAVIVGMTIFGYYYICDPLTSGKIQRTDQIVPYFMMDVFGSVPGVNGLLISGAFCASLSSMSSVVNSFASMFGQDVIKTICPDITDSRYTIVVKIISASLGLLTIVLAFLASVLGDVLQTALSISGLTGGPTLGVFLMGLFFPRANSKGAISGFIGGTLVGLFFYVGSKFYPPIVHSPPLSDEGCWVPMDNQTTTTYPEGAMVTNMYSYPYTTTGPPEPVHNTIFALSYMYYSVVTALACVAIGLVVSYLTSMTSHELAHPTLLAPIIARKYIKLESPRENRNDTSNDRVYVPLEKK